MKIKSLIDVGYVKKGDILEALESPDKKTVIGFDSHGDVSHFRNGDFEIIEELEKHTVPAISEKRFTIEELKELKELFK